MAETRVILVASYTGRKLARDVYRDRNMLLLSKGHVLTETVIHKLKASGVVYVYLEDEDPME